MILSCQNNQLYAQHGLKDFSVSSMHPLKNLDTHLFSGDFHTLDSCHAGKAPLASAVQNRMYWSVENLHWATAADSGLYSHCRSLDNEIIFRSGGTSQCTEGSLDMASAQSTSDSLRNLSLHAKQTSLSVQNVLLPPFAKAPQWLFPSAEERALQRDAKKELKEKLRLHSSKVAEPCKPQVALPNLMAQEFFECQMCQQYKNGSAVNCCAVLVEHTALRHSLTGRQRLCFAHRLISPEDIKQKAQRRLQLQRQNSYPNLPFQHAGESHEMAKSRTAEKLEQYSGETDVKATLGQSKKGCCKGRLYIPTFEEFKQMRSKKANSSASSSRPTDCLNKTLPADQTLEEENNKNNCPAALRTKAAEAVDEAAVTVEDDDDVFHENHASAGFSQYPSTWDGFRMSSLEVKDRTCQISTPNRTPVPICSSPIPRSPLQAVAVHRAGQEVFSDEQQKGETRQLNDVLHLAGQSQASEAQSSCCSSLLLEATDLTSYGAKLQKMKDEFIGSALELIKKR